MRLGPGSCRVAEFPVDDIRLGPNDTTSRDSALELAPDPVLQLAEAPRSEHEHFAVLVAGKPARAVPRPNDEAADTAEPTDDALVLMERAVASRDPLERGPAGFLSACKDLTFSKQKVRHSRLH